jgi:hypothetical protein
MRQRSKPSPASVALVTGAALLVPAVLLFLAASLNALARLDWPPSTPGFTDGPMPEPPSPGTPFYLTALVSGIALALTGILMSVAAEQIAPRVILIAELVVILGITLVAAGDSLVKRHEEPERDGTRVCQEHSGGDTTCPGG